MKYKNLIKISLITSALLFTTLNAKEKNSLSTVIVTAQKNVQNVQDVPISIDVFDEVKLEDYSISTLEDIAKYTPNLLFFNTGQDGQISPSIRGIIANISAYSTPISLYVDGVPTMNSSGFNDPLMDIERIEVLKGPQGTLYGKNSEAGVINIITRKPNNETRGKIFGVFGNDGKREIGLNVSGPIIKNKFYGAISYKHDEKDGFIKHLITGEKVNYKENDYGKINLRYTPTDTLDISFISSRYESDDGARDWAPANTGDNPTVSPNLKNTANLEISTYALNIDYSLNNNTKIKSITTKRVNNDEAVTDNDMSFQTLRHYYRDYKYDTISQELRLEKDLDKIKIITGVYADKSEDDLFLKAVTMFDPTGANSKPEHFTSKTYSLFSNIIYPLNQKWTLNGGIRFDKEKKDFQIENTTISDEEEWDNISPKLSLQYNINKNSMTYITIAKAYMSGGFNPVAPSADKRSYDEESLISYEIGYKSTLFNNRVKLNGAIYYMDIDDMQVQILPDLMTYYMENAASASSKGIEMDLEAILSDEFSLFSSFGINETKFDDYSDNYGNYKDKYNPYAPKYNFNIGLQYRHSLGYYFRADLNGYGKMYYNVANTRAQDAYELVNAKVGYESDSYDIYLYSNNLFDKNYDAKKAYFQGNTTIYKEDREVGIRLTYRF